jgi:hypothetical protein
MQLDSTATAKCRICAAADTMQEALCLLWQDRAIWNEERRCLVFVSNKSLDLLR